MPFALRPPPRQPRAGLFRTPGVKASMRPWPWKGRCEASKVEETRQSRLLGLRRQTPIVTHAGLEKTASVHAAFVFRMTKAVFTPRVFLCHLLSLETSVLQDALFFFALSVMPSLPFLSSRFSLFFFLATPPQRPCLQPLALSTPSAFLFVLAVNLSKTTLSPSGGRLQ